MRAVATGGKLQAARHKHKQLTSELLASRLRLEACNLRLAS